MKIRYFAFLCIIGYSLASPAEITVCNYVETPCDDYGNHYDCSVMGWSIFAKYCSPRDHSTIPKKTQLPISNVEHQDAACRGIQ